MDTNGHTPLCEDYISFETAKLLKEKGFDEATIGYYYIISEIPEKIKFFDSPISIYHSDGLIGCIQAPTLQMAMKWLREVNKWHIEISRGEYGYFVHIVSAKNLSTENYTVQLEGGYNLSYEEACEAAIKYCLENLI